MQDLTGKFTAGAAAILHICDKTRVGIVLVHADGGTAYCTRCRQRWTMHEFVKAAASDCFEMIDRADAAEEAQQDAAPLGN